MALFVVSFAFAASDSCDPVNGNCADADCNSVFITPFTGWMAYPPENCKTDFVNWIYHSVNGETSAFCDLVIDSDVGNCAMVSRMNSWAIVCPSEKRKNNNDVTADDCYCQRYMGTCPTKEDYDNYFNFEDSFFKLPSCTPITGNSAVDSACCVKDNAYTSLDKKSTHGDYVSCVANAVFNLKKSGMDANQGGAIVKAAADSRVNMPANSNKGMNGDVLTLAVLGFLAIISFLELNLTNVKK